MKGLDIKDTGSNARFNLPRPLLYIILATIETYLLVIYLPEYSPDISRRRLTLRLFLVHIFLQAVWDILIFPAFFSPYRNIPGPAGYFTADSILFDNPRGLKCLRWMMEIPNDGLLRTIAYDGEEFLVITSPEVYADVLVHKTYDFVKPFLLRKFLSRILGWGLIVSEGNMHRVQRRALMPAFQLKNIRDLYPLMWDKAMLLTNMLEQELARNSKSNVQDGDTFVNGSLDIATWSSRLTLDIIGPAAMGRDFRSLQDTSTPIAQNYLELLQPNLRSLLFFAFSLIVPPWVSENWPSSTNTTIKRTMREIREVCRDIIREKKVGLGATDEADSSASNDILSIMLRGKDLEDEVCVDQMLTFLAAGHETTANALAWTCYQLGKNTSYQIALRKELLGAIANPNQPISPAELESLPLLNAICNEVLRLHPTVPVTTRQTTKDVVLAGHLVKKDCWLVLCPWATNRDPKSWGSDSQSFRPERWIDLAESNDHASEKKERLNSHGGSSTNYAMMTFLHGPRSCIGQGFAKAELRCAVATLFGRFSMKLLRPDEEIVSVGAISPKPRGGIHVTMTVLKEWCAEP